MADLRPLHDMPGPGTLYRLTGTTRDRAPILLTHGTFSNADTMLPLAQYLGATGRPVYVIAWRDRTGVPGSFTFHDLAEDEIATALHALPRPAHLVAHSGGGLAMCFAMTDPELRAKTKSLTLIATQGTHLRNAPWPAYPSIRVLTALAKRRGFWHRKLLNLGPCHESAALLAQWQRFNHMKTIRTRDGHDLVPQLAGLGLPVLALAGAADTVIARPEGCAHLAHAFGPQAQVHICSQATDGEDMSRSSLIRSRIAARTVWPRNAAFLDANDPDDPSTA